MSCDLCGSRCQGSRCADCEAIKRGEKIFEARSDGDATPDEEPTPDNPHDVTAWGDADE